MKHFLLDSAVSYINKGRAVFILNQDKIPHARCAYCKTQPSNPTHYDVCTCLNTPDNNSLCHGVYAATTSTDTMSHWLTEYPDTQSIAQRTGKASGIFVVETDTKHNGPEVLAAYAAQYGGMPETETHMSQSGGMHYVFVLPEGTEIRNHTGTGAILPGVDVKGEGGYALLPPSKGDNGSYVVVNSTKPSVAPQWLLDLILSKQTPRVPKSDIVTFSIDDISDEVSDKAKKVMNKWLRLIAEAEDGTQNTLLYTGSRVLFSLVFAQLLDEDEARTLLEEAADEGGHPNDRIQRTINSAFDAAEADPDSFDDMSETPTAFYKGEFYRRYSTDVPGSYSRFMAKHHDKFGYVTDRGVFAAYSPRTGFWNLGNPSKAAKDKSPVQHLVTDTFFTLRQTEKALWPAEPLPGATVGKGPQTWEEVFTAYLSKANGSMGVQDAVTKVLNYETPSVDGTYINGMGAHEFDNCGDVLPFRNGVLDLATGSFRSVTKEDHITTYLPWDYSPSQECPEFEAMMKRAQPDKGMRDYLQRRAGYALSVSTSEKKFFIDQGVADAGKSTVNLILSEILGSFSYTADKDLFYASGEETPEKKANLFQKRMVLLDEWNGSHKINSTLIKSVSAGSPDNGRFLYGDNFDFTHTAKVFITSNADVKMDLDSGIITRLVVVPWIKPISQEQKQLDQGRTNGQDFYKWVVAKERMGIINWMMKGYQMWRERPLSVDVPEAVTEATQAYVDSDPVKAYYFENWVRTSDPKDKVKCSDFADSFLAQYDGDDALEFNAVKITHAIKNLQVSWKKSVKFPDGKVTSGYIGIKLKEGK